MVKVWAMPKGMPNVNLYKILSLPDFSPAEKIAERYRELAKIHHPDKGGKKENMQKLNEIYEILSKHKDEYDAHLRNAFQPAVRVVIQTWTGTSTTTGNWTYYGY